MHKDDRGRIQHMLDAAKEAVELAKGKSREDFESERMLNLALVRLVEIVGEAASKVSLDYKKQNSGIPWSQIVGMRNRLIHGYDEIDFDILYETVTTELPPLIVTLESQGGLEKKL